MTGEKTVVELVLDGRTILEVHRGHCKVDRLFDKASIDGQEVESAEFDPDPDFDRYRVRLTIRRA